MDTIPFSCTAHFNESKLIIIIKVNKLDEPYFINAAHGQRVIRKWGTHIFNIRIHFPIKVTSAINISFLIYYIRNYSCI